MKNIVKKKQNFRRSCSIRTNRKQTPNPRKIHKMLKSSQMGTNSPLGSVKESMEILV